MIVATGNAAEVAALQQVLSLDGAEAEVVTEGRAVLDLAKKREPQAVMIDASLNGLDLGHVSRVLARHPSTSATAVVVLAPADADEAAIRRLKAIESFSLVRRPLTCSTIRETFRSAVAYARKAAAERDAASAKPGSSKLVRGCDTLLRRSISCPFHSFGVPVDHFQLRAGKIYSETDIFDQPVYKKAARDADFVDYNLVAVSVCRECFFASNDPNYFEDDARGMATVRDRGEGVGRAAYRIDSLTRGEISNAAGHRGLLAFDRLGREPDASFFGHTRTPEEALIVYELASASSRLLYTSAPVRRSGELLRLGGYELRRASLHAQLQHPVEVVAKHRRAAAKWLAKAFGECKGAAMYKAAYQVLAVHISLGTDASGFPYLQALKDQARLSRRDQDDPVALEKFLRRAQNLWADRSMHRMTPTDAKKAA